MAGRAGSRWQPPVFWPAPPPAGMIAGSTCVGLHLAMTQGVIYGMLSSYIPATTLPGLGRITGTAWSLSDLILGGWVGWRMGVGPWHAVLCSLLTSVHCQRCTAGRLTGRGSVTHSTAMTRCNGSICHYTWQAASRAARGQAPLCLWALTNSVTWVPAWLGLPSGVAFPTLRCSHSARLQALSWRMQTRWQATSATSQRSVAWGPQVYMCLLVAKELLHPGPPRESRHRCPRRLLRFTAQHVVPTMQDTNMQAASWGGPQFRRWRLWRCCCSARLGSWAGSHLQRQWRATPTLAAAAAATAPAAASETSSWPLVCSQLELSAPGGFFFLSCSICTRTLPPFNPTRSSCVDAWLGTAFGGVSCRYNDGAIY